MEELCWGREISMEAGEGRCYNELVSLGVANKIEAAAADSCLSLDKIV